ncbi:DNA-3-methyladenine glycosylase family protein [Tahibacter harae]|uniref:DNA-3-methyladenine glycosylase family protein n=1 Tax=Tahibacter harae TaxID=2963937 RepID=UPI00272E4BDD|nr:AlkA N-terminal domain-containing protein [Tahibacter harae]
MRRKTAEAGVQPAPAVQHARLELPRGYPAEQVLAFYARRAIPGVELVEAGRYRRSFLHAGEPGWLQFDLGTGAVTVEHADPAALPLVLARLRLLFDVDAPQARIRRALGRDPRLAALLRVHGDIRVPGCWDGFELGVRAVLGQQITVAAARTIAGRLVARHAQRIAAAAAGEPCHSLFPGAAALATANLDALGLPGARVATLHALASAVAAGELSFQPGQIPAEFVARCTAVRGIGAWTAHYMAMRALRDADAFPAADIVLRKVLQPGTTLSPRALEEASQAWRPFRAYAVLLLWRAA